MTEAHVAVIPGGTGSVGRQLVPMLLDRGFKVAVTYLIPEDANVMEESLHLDEIGRASCRERV